jgi:hypothetical protein
VKIAIKYYGAPSARVTVDALPCGVPGLAIHARHKAPGWAITHIRSGLGVALFSASDPEAVLAAAQALAPLADWTASAWDISDAVTGNEVLAVTARYGVDLGTVRSGNDYDDVAEVAR